MDKRHFTLTLAGVLTIVSGWITMIGGSLICIIMAIIAKMFVVVLGIIICIPVGWLMTIFGGGILQLNSEVGGLLGAVFSLKNNSKSESLKATKITKTTAVTSSNIAKEIDLIETTYVTSVKKIKSIVDDKKEENDNVFNFYINRLAEISWYKDSNDIITEYKDKYAKLKAGKEEARLEKIYSKSLPILKDCLAKESIENYDLFLVEYNKLKEIEAYKDLAIELPKLMDEYTKKKKEFYTRQANEIIESAKNKLSPILDNNINSVIEYVNFKESYASAIASLDILSDNLEAQALTTKAKEAYVVLAEKFEAEAENEYAIYDSKMKAATTEAEMSSLLTEIIKSNNPDLDQIKNELSTKLDKERKYNNLVSQFNKLTSKTMQNDITILSNNFKQLGDFKDAKDYVTEIGIYKKLLSNMDYSLFRGKVKSHNLTEAQYESGIAAIRKTGQYKAVKIFIKELQKLHDAE